MNQKSLTTKRILARITELRAENQHSPAKLKFLEKNETLLTREKNYAKRKGFFNLMEEELKAWDRRPSNPFESHSLPKEQKVFAELVVSKIGETVGFLKDEGVKAGIDEATTRRILLLTFRSIGEKSGLAYRSLIQTLRHNL